MRHKILVTGACGFLGKHLCRYLNALDLKKELIGTDNVEIGNQDCQEYYCVDLVNDDDVNRLINQTKPKYILHLAGLFSASSDFQVYKSNVLSVMTILEAVRKHRSDAVVMIIGSAAEYGLVDSNQLPVNEVTPCEPVTAYGMSKKLATEVAIYYHRVHGLCTMIARPFQLIGKGVTSRLAPGAFAEQLKGCVLEGNPVIKVGNLESSRDFLDVQDAIEVLWLMCQQPAPGQIFNLCSGQSVKVRDLLNLMIEIFGTRVEVEIDKSKLRGRYDVLNIYGSYQKVFQHYGWRPHTPLSTSIRKMFE